jgi:hypothetical protein
MRVSAGLGVRGDVLVGEPVSSAGAVRTVIEVGEEFIITDED